jgi:hypothetical protein
MRCSRRPILRDHQRRRASARRLPGRRDHSMNGYDPDLLTEGLARPTQRASEIALDEFRRARPTFEAKIRRYEPQVVAFLGKRALSAMLARPPTPSCATHSDLTVARDL